MTTLSDLRLKSKLYYYVGHVTSVYDGDTFTVDLDLGLGLWRRGQTVRLWKVNTPELQGADRERGLQVRDFVRDLIQDKAILLRTILDKRGDDRTEKFGRLLGEALVPGEDGEALNVNELLLARGMAVAMDEGGTLVRVVSRPPGEHRGPAQAVLCPFCGEARPVDLQAGLVGQCPNCLDGPFALPQP